MFTGIVEEMGAVKELHLKKNLAILTIQAKKIQKGIKLGDSISVNGACLTVSVIKGMALSFDMMAETLTKTNLGKLKNGDKVNLERALRADGRLDGHIVTGHIDQIATVTKLVKQENYLELRFSVDKNMARYIVPKGSICVNGVSLTVGEVAKNYFSVYLIPLTQKETNLGFLQKGQTVNIEIDILAKYIEKQMANRS
ncbi:MAG: riboflavin synthase [Candidatus Omnitrophica bacterium]|nr:riboflavin synthase [Candidatus Omnitrophota bacterium]